MIDGTFILVNNIRPECVGLKSENFELKKAVRSDASECIELEYEMYQISEYDNLFSLFDDQFSKFGTERKRYLFSGTEYSNDFYLYFYSSDPEADVTSLMDAIRLFELTSAGAGTVLRVFNGVCMEKHGYLETLNKVAIQLKRISLEDEIRFNILHSTITGISGSENKGWLSDLIDFWREAYRIENPQTAYMNMIVIMEIFSRWVEEYMDANSTLKCARDTDIELKGKNSRISSTKKIALFTARLLSDGDRESYLGLKKAISILYYKRNDFIHNGSDIEDTCHKMMFNVIRCMIGRMAVFKYDKKTLMNSILENKIPKMMNDKDFCISGTAIDDFIMSFDR